MPFTKCMACRIDCDPAALEALQDIAGYLMERSPSGARNVLLDIRASIDLLADWPRLGRALESVPFRQVIS